MSGQPPQKWKPLFDNSGIEFGYRPLANRIGMDHTLMLGGGTSVIGQDEWAVVAGWVAAQFADRGRRNLQCVGDVVDGVVAESERNVIRAMVRALLAAHQD